jgi:hypothetical protein
MPWALGTRLVFALLLAAALPARAADPVLTFLLGMAREMMAQPKAAAVPAPELPEVYPGTTVQPVLLKRLIDDSFLYLAAPQRAEIFDALNAELLKPKNFAVRASMIEYFAYRALQVRAAQLRLGQLSLREKQFLVEEFRQELKALPEEDAVQLRDMLHRGLLPVPADLNQLLLAAFS